MSEQLLNPDCVAGKHAACSGTAWDEEKDALDVCQCLCHRKDEAFT